MTRLKFNVREFTLVILLAFWLTNCINNNRDNSNGSTTPPENAPQRLNYRIEKTYPHDTSSFTEGLLVYKGAMYESTGLEGKSKLLKVNLSTGKPIKSVDIDPRNFGEGIAILRDTIYQLTYREHVVFVYDSNFKKIREMYFDMDTHQGWGMTTDGNNLIASDGSSTIYFFDTYFKLLKRINVTDAGTPVPNVNELEWIDGFIYANQWGYPYLYKIDATNGRVVGKADFTDLINEVKNKYAATDSFNGIAYDAASKKIYITGKNWPQLYEVKFE
jgi:glutaminyl-peptide cyclotransferase